MKRTFQQWVQYAREGKTEEECWEVTPVPGIDVRRYITYNETKMPISRASYLHFVGTIPDGLVVCHKCNNPNCLNPGHLYLATPWQNIRDARNDGLLGKGGMDKGGVRLDAVGELNPAAKLTEEKVKLIRLKRASGVLLRELSVEFSVSETVIRHVVSRKTWKHVD